MFRTYIGAESGAFRLTGDQLQALGLAEHTVSAIHAWAGPDTTGTTNDTVLAGTYGEGIFRSTDGGATWTRQDTYDDDIHYVTGHPQRADEIWLALGWAAMQDRDDVDRGKLGGVARSDDGGQNWTKQIDHDYTRAVLIPPTHPHLVLAGPAKQVGRQGSIVVSSDGGETWQPAGDGLEQPMSDMVEQFVSAPDGSIWAICSGGRLLRAEPDTWRWRSVLPASADAIQVQSVSFVTGT